MTKQQEEQARGWFAVGFLALVLFSPPLILYLLFGWKAGLAGAGVPVFFVFAMWQAGDLTFASRSDNASTGGPSL